MKIKVLFLLLCLLGVTVEAQRQRLYRPGPLNVPPVQGRDVACTGEPCTFGAEANTVAENYDVTGLSPNTPYRVSPPKACSVGDTALPGFPYGWPVIYTTNGSGAMSIPVNATTNCTIIIGERIVNVNSGATLQTAINNAQPGDTLVLAAGITFTGSFTLKAGNTGWIGIRCADTATKLEGNATQGVLPTAATARYWYIEDCLLTNTINPAADILRLGESSSAQNSLSLVPEFFVLDNVRVMGHATNGQRMGVALHTGAAKIINSEIKNIFAVSAQSIGVAMGNGPGPYLIADNTIEAAAINVFSGGIDPPIIGLVPADIFVLRNTIRKDPLWEKNGNLTIWNLIEWKNAKRVTVMYNTFENMWKAPSNSWGLSSWNKSVDQVVGGTYTCTLCVVSDVYYGYNEWLKVSGGPQVTAIGEGSPIPMSNITFEHNFFDIDVSQWTTQSQTGAGRFSMSFNGVHGAKFRHNTIINTTTSSIFIAPEGIANNNFEFVNNIFMESDLGFKGAGTTEGTNTINTYFPSATLGGNLFQTNGGTYPSGFTGVASLVTNAKYNPITRLLDSDSPYKNAGVGGVDPGWDGTGGRPTDGPSPPVGEPDTDITANSCSRNDVNTAFTNATDANKDGWTVVQLPPCADTGWTSGIDWSPPANTLVRGAGSLSTLGGGDATNIVDNSQTDAPLLRITIASTGVFRMSGITIKGGNGVLKNAGMTQFNGPGNLRIDHMHWNTHTYSTAAKGASKLFSLWGAVYGVLHDSLIDTSTSSAFYFYQGYINGRSDLSWTLPTNFGGDTFFFIEDNQFNGDITSIASRTSDCFAGGKVVLRFNTLSYVGGQEAHATGSTGDRGCRAFENYNNLHKKLPGQTGNPPYVMIDAKVPGLMWWGNHAEDGAVNHGAQTRVTRSTNSTYNQGIPPNGFGYAWGTPRTGTVNVNANGTSVTLASGTNFNTAWPAGTMIQIVGASCPSEGAPPNSSSCKISSVGSTSALTLSTNTGGALNGAAYYVGSPWDGNTDVYGYPAIDQPGRGAGDLLTGEFPTRVNDTTGVASWPNQVLEPQYSWNNTTVNMTGNMYDNQDTNRIQANRDYYPQASGVQTQGPPIPMPFNGSSGTGWGTLANRPTTCTTGVGYFATDQGSWNKTTSNPLGVQRNGQSGILYRCTNIGGVPWSVYYTPYEYPHPLRGESGGGDLPADITAVNCSQTSVQTALTNASDVNSDGYTVIQLPACSETWTSELIWSAPANTIIRGAGTPSGRGSPGQTVITDAFASTSPMLRITTHANGVFRMSAITFQGGSVGNNQKDAMIYFQGSSTQFRFHNMTVDGDSYSDKPGGGPQGRTLRFWGCVKGVIDSNIFHANGSFHLNWGGCDAGGEGDVEWANDTGFGTNNFLVFENNTVTSSDQYGAINDCDHGGKWVVRYNTVYGASVQTHPTGGSGRGRGCRATEFYNNDLNPHPTAGAQFNAFFLSSGPSLVWGNNATNGYTNFITLHSMLRLGHSSCGGTGTYCQSNAPAGWGYCGSSFNGTASPWSANTSTGYPCLDQPGRGKGDLLSGGFPNAVNTTTGTATWPNQALEPVREWLNTWASEGGGGSLIAVYQGDVLVENQDFYKYVGSVQTSATSPFSGANGIGVGTIENRPKSCTTGRAYWATNEGEWNSTNGATPDGKMYVCTSTNTWTARYGDASNTTGLPLAYPHPLRGGS